MFYYPLYLFIYYFTNLTHKFNHSQYYEREEQPHNARCALSLAIGRFERVCIRAEKAVPKNTAFADMTTVSLFAPSLSHTLSFLAYEAISNGFAVTQNQSSTRQNNPTTTKKKKKRTCRFCWRIYWL